MVHGHFAYYIYENLTATDWVRTKELFFHLFVLFFMLFPVSYHSPIMWNYHFHVFHSPIMWKCHSHVQLILSCSYLFLFCIWPYVLVIRHRKWIEAKSETEKYTYLYLHTHTYIYIIIYISNEKMKITKKRQQNWKNTHTHIYRNPHTKKTKTNMKTKI